MNATTRTRMCWMAGTAWAMLSAATALGAVSGVSRDARQQTLLRDANKLENQGKYVKAARTYRRSALYTHDDKTKALLLVREGDCYYSAGKPYQAFDCYRSLLQDYPLFVPYEHVIPRLRDLAERFVRGDGTFLGVRDRDKAIEIYQLIQQEVPSLKTSVEDSLRLARLLVQKQRQPEAIDVYRGLLRRDITGKQATTAHLDLGRLLLQQSRHGDGDGTIAREARDQLMDVLRLGSQTSRRNEAESLLKRLRGEQAEKLYKLGEFYSRDPHRRLPAARRYLGDALSQYPDTPAAKRAKTLLAQLPPGIASAAARSGEPTAVQGVRAPRAPRATPAQPPPGATATETATAPPPAPVVKPKRFKPLEEQDNMHKYLRPLGDINDLDKGDKAK